MEARIAAANRNARAELRTMTSIGVVPPPERLLGREPEPFVVKSPLLAEDQTPSPEAGRKAFQMTAVETQPEPTAAPDLMNFSDEADGFREEETKLSPALETMLRNETLLASKSDAARQEAARHLFGIENKAEVDARLRNAGVSRDTIAKEIARCAPALEGDALKPLAP